MTAARVLVTCEHGGNRIPAAYRALFRGHRAALQSHRGHDPGALALARDLSRRLRAPLVASTVSRLLVELNRSPGHPRLFSEITRELPDKTKRELLVRYYLPYRERAESRVIAAMRRRERLVHLSAHTFTPVLDGVTRAADIGLLYDPARRRESRLCLAWQRELTSREPRLRVRRNYPYRGTADGLTTHLRRRYPASCYAGIEIEVNQAHTVGDPREWSRLRRTIVEAFAAALRATA